MSQLRDDNTAAAGSRLAHRAGTASSFLARAARSEAGGPQRVTMKVARAARFHPPADARQPLVMFAGGTGVAPFLGFIQERARHHHAGPMWLFMATRSRQELHFADELAQQAAAGRLRVQVAFSQEDVTATFASDGAGVTFAPGRRCRIDALLLSDDNTRLLWDLLRSGEEGGREGAFFVCGRAGFARTVTESLAAIARRCGPGTTARRAPAATERMHRLVGERRLSQEVYSSDAPDGRPRRPRYDLSEVALHNDAANGYWIVLEGRVYDVTDFIHTHPGGSSVLRGYAGMDATIAYRRVGHHTRPEHDALLAPLEIGSVRKRRLTGDAQADERSSPSGPDVYRAWVGLLWLVVEMQNALRIDYTIRHGATTRGERPTRPSRYKTQLLLEVHRRVLLTYLPDLLGPQLRAVWQATIRAGGAVEDPRWMPRRVEQVLDAHAAQAARAALAGLERALRRDCVADRLRLSAACPVLMEHDTGLLEQVKHAVRAGVRVLERQEAPEAPRRDTAELRSLARRIPDQVLAYLTALASPAGRDTRPDPVSDPVLVQ